MRIVRMFFLELNENGCRLCGVLMGVVDGVGTTEKFVMRRARFLYSEGFMFEHNWGKEAMDSQAIISGLRSVSWQLIRNYFSFQNSPG